MSPLPTEANMGSGEEVSPEYLKDGPVVNRKCTDCLCCMFFFLFAVGWGMCGVTGYLRGDPEILTYPYDYDGNQCGAPGSKAEEYPFLYFPYPVPDCLDYTVCVKDCPDDSASSIECYLNTAFSDCLFVGISEFECVGLNLGVYSADGYLSRFCLPNIKENLGNVNRVIAWSI